MYSNSDSMIQAIKKSEAEEQSGYKFSLVHVLVKRDNSTESPIVTKDIIICVDVGRTPFGLKPQADDITEHQLDAATDTP